MIPIFDCNYHKQVVQVIEDRTFYHGTCVDSAEKIRENGFTVLLKTNGATAANKFSDYDAEKYNYFTHEKYVAAFYAKTTATAQNDLGDIISFVLPFEIKAERDPYDLKGMMTKEPIPKYCILPKDHRYTAESVKKVAKILKIDIPEQKEELNKIAQNITVSPRSEVCIKYHRLSTNNLPFNKTIESRQFKTLFDPKTENLDEIRKAMGK